MIFYDGTACAQCLYVCVSQILILFASDVEHEATCRSLFTTLCTRTLQILNTGWLLQITLSGINPYDMADTEIQLFPDVITIPLIEYLLKSHINPYCNTYIITSAKEVMFLPVFVCLFVCLSVC